MDKKPKILIGFVLLFLISSAFIGISLQNIRTKVSTAELTLGENQFKINFYISPQDRQQFEKLRGELSLPENIEKGISFELDSTSTARLAFISPVKSEINFSKKDIRIEGRLIRPYTTKTLSTHQLMLPKNTNVAIAGSNLAQFAKSKLDFPQPLLEWIEKNATPQTSQYFFNVQPNSSIFAFQSQNPIDDLKNLESPELKLKEDSAEDIKIFYLNFQDPVNSQEKTISITKIEDIIFIAPAGETIKEVINFQKNPKDEIDFPKKSKEQISYAIYAQNNSEQFPQILTNLVFKSRPQTLEFAKNIDSFYLALSKKSFSALINLK